MNIKFISEIYLRGMASQLEDGTKVQNRSPLIEPRIQNSKLALMDKNWV